jgi:hypothetical protein
VAALAVRAYVGIRGEVDVSVKIEIASQAKALLRGRWTCEQIVAAVEAFAVLPAEPRRFALWAHRRRLTSRGVSA